MKLKKYCHSIGFKATELKSGFYTTSDGAQIYWESCGNPKGAPALFLHGGPGARLRTGHRKYFDLDLFYLISFDQRGCGRSTPSITSDEVDINSFTTDRLIEDSEELREFFNVEKWLVSGVSWGTTLGLAYASKFPSVVSGLLLAAVTTGTKEEVKWMREDLKTIFPLEWMRFSKVVEDGESVIDAYYREILSDDESRRKKAAREWCRWEDVHVSLNPGFSPNKRFDDENFRLVFATYVIHFWKHFSFLSEDFVESLEKLSGLPTVLIHGRHDISCPLKYVCEVHNHIKGSELIVIESEGHGGELMFREFRKAAVSMCEI